MPAAHTANHIETMIISTLLAVSALAPSTTAATVAQPLPAPAPAAQPRIEQARQTSSDRATTFGGMLAQGQGSSNLSMGGSFTTGAGGAMVSVTGSPAPGVYQLQLDDPGTGWQESVLLGVPTVHAVGTTPLLVMFHGSDVSEWDCYINGEDMFEGARNRGWYVLAPLGAHQLNFGIDYSHENIEYALSMFVDMLPIDENRIYGVGFSMGGGTMTSYAARHQNPNKPRFAALTNHTGGSSVAFSYWNSNHTENFEHPLMFGGSPSEFPFRYSQASSLDINPDTLAVDADTDQARNLANTPTLNWHADYDPNANLILATQTLYNRLSSFGGETYLLTPNQSVHKWWTIDENTALNYLASKTLTTPTEGEHRMLADRETSWLHFYVYQDQGGAFTPFTWNLDSTANRLEIKSTSNLKKIGVNTGSLGLDTSSEVEIMMNATDGPNEITILSGYQNAPLEVLRNGVPTTDWVYTPAADMVTLNEYDAESSPVWTIRP